MERDSLQRLGIKVSGSGHHHVVSAGLIGGERLCKHRIAIGPPGDCVEDRRSGDRTDPTADAAASGSKLSSGTEGGGNGGGCEGCGGSAPLQYSNCGVTTRGERPQGTAGSGMGGVRPTRKGGNAVEGHCTRWGQPVDDCGRGGLVVEDWDRG